MNPGTIATVPGVGAPPHNRFLPSHTGRRLALGVLLAAAGYYAGAYLSIALRAPPAGISTMWPPNAILLAALLLSPPRKWVWYLAAALPAHVHVVANFQPGVPLFINFVQYGGNILQVLIAAGALRRLGLAPPRFDEVRGVTWFIFIAAFAAPVIASTVTVYLFNIAGWVPDFWLGLRRRILTNTVPALALTPLLISAVTDGSAALRRIPPQKWAEFGLLVISVFAVGFAALGWPSQGNEPFPGLQYVILPVLLWATVRFGHIALSFCILVVASLSLTFAYFGRGPFETLARAENVLSLQVFLVAMAVPFKLLAAIIKERQRAEDALRQSQQRHNMATAAASVGVWDWDLTTGTIDTDPVIKAMLGYEGDELHNSLNGWTECVHPDDIEESRARAQAHIEGASTAFESEHRVFHKDGSIRWFLARGVVSERVNGRAIRMLGTTTDITERKRAEEELRGSGERVRELAGRLISAQEEERRRIARDLHDDLNQKVAALSIEISNIRHQLGAEAPSVSGDLYDLQARVAELAYDIRELSHEIHPATLEHAGLVPALKAFAAGLRKLEGLDLQLNLPASCDSIPQEVAICIYRVAQESIRNVMRHSGIDTAQVILTRSDDEVTLMVRDEGCGFDVTHLRDYDGLGLISIEERVRLLNGRVEIQSREGGGTTLQVYIPLSRDPPAEPVPAFYQGRNGEGQLDGDGQELAGR